MAGDTAALVERLRLRAKKFHIRSVQTQGLTAIQHDDDDKLLREAADALDALTEQHAQPITMLHDPDAVPSQDAWQATANLLIAERDAAERRLEQAEQALAEVGRITDVMIGNGPGAIEAYHTPGKGLPTMYWHLVDHAKEIRAALAAVSPPLTEPGVSNASGGQARPGSVSGGGTQGDTAREHQFCDGMDGPLPCSKSKGHDGPHYFYNP